MEHVEADVCIVGAGFAGLSAAWRLHQAGLTVAVLEARDRVGGRSWSVPLADGTAVDRGGGWFGPGQDRSYALAADMGRATYPTWHEGDNVLVRNGEPLRYKGTIPLRMNPLQLASLGVAVARLDDMARQVPLEAPWTAAKAREWDAQTLGRWLDKNVDGGLGRQMLQAMLTDLFTCDLAEVSLLGALFLIHANNGIEDMGNVRNGHQQDRVVGGTQSIAIAVRERLGAAVRLDSPVREITWRANGVRASANRVTVTARRAIVAVPQWLSERIWWDPPLPRERAQLIQRVPTGQMYKIHLVYPTPFWRADGLTGQTLDVDSPFPLTLDACGPTPPPGILCVLTAGPHATEVARLLPEQRRSAVVEAMTRRFGPRATEVADYIEQDWTAENWTRGAMITHFPPGVLTTFGPALRAPVGPLHWAGTETATIMHGTIDGAIRSGERAAAEVLAAASEPVSGG